MLDLFITIFIVFISAGLITSWSETIDQIKRINDEAEEDNRQKLEGGFDD